MRPPARFEVAIEKFLTNATALLWQHWSWLKLIKPTVLIGWDHLDLIFCGFIANKWTPPPPPHWILVSNFWFVQCGTTFLYYYFIMGSNALGFMQSLWWQKTFFSMLWRLIAEVSSILQAKSIQVNLTLCFQAAQTWSQKEMVYICACILF